MTNGELRSHDADLAFSSSGVSWAAIFAGAATAAVISLILLILGVGLGFSAMSPWSHSGASAETIGFSTIIWLAFTQIAAAGLGGYLAGRLRVKWANIHNDEVYFRDTAHGFLAWAIASLATAALLGSAVSAVIGGGIQAGTSVASNVAGAATTAAGGAIQADGKSLGFYVDSLFRNDQPLSAATEADLRTEATTIFTHDLQAGALSAENKQYLGKLVAQRTGLSQPEAEQRVSSLFDKASKALADAKAAAKEAADTARKVAAYSALWMFVTLLCGAFAASLAATLGGKQRDAVI